MYALHFGENFSTFIDQYDHLEQHGNMANFSIWDETLQNGHTPNGLQVNRGPKFYFKISPQNLIF